MRRGHVHLRVPRELLHLAQHGLAVAAAHARIDHQRGARADDDADVRHLADVAVGDGVAVRAEFHRGAFLDEGRCDGTAALRGRHDDEGNEQNQCTQDWFHDCLPSRVTHFSESYMLWPRYGVRCGTRWMKAAHMRKANASTPTAMRK